VASAGRTLLVIIDTTTISSAEMMVIGSAIV
jgi:hypothetical protein